jgi:two-component system, NarL family, response regulator NreC
MNEVIRILVASDFPLTRMGLTQYVRNQPDMQVVGQATDRVDALEKAVEMKPDIIIIDVTNHFQDWPGAIATLKTCLPEVKVLVLTMTETVEELLEAERAGAAGHLPKNFTGEQELGMVRAMVCK